MTELLVDVASFAIATRPDLELAGRQLAAQGINWLSPSLLADLWQAFSPGPQYSNLRTFPEAYGVFVDNATGHLAWYRGERRTDHVGRYYLWRRCWLIRAEDAARLRYRVDAFRFIADASAESGYTPTIAPVSVHLKPEEQRLAEIVDQNSTQEGWITLWRALTTSAADRRLPLAVLNGPIDPKVILDLAEAVALALPLGWRPRWSFCTSVCDASVCKSPIKFMLLRYNLENQEVLDAQALAPVVGLPQESYGRLLEDAAAQSFVADLQAALVQVEQTRPKDMRELAGRLYKRLWQHYGLQPLWDCLLNKDAAQDIRLLMNELTQQRFDRSRLIAELPWDRLSAAELPLVLPNLSALREQLPPSVQGQVDQRAFELALDHVLKVQDTAGRLAAVSRLMITYPWQQSQATDLVLRVVQDGFQSKDAGALAELLRLTWQKYPDIARSLIESGHTDEMILAVAIGFYWQRLPYRALSTKTYLVRAAGREWIVRQPSVSDESDGGPPANLTTRHPSVQFFLLQMPDPRGGGMIAVRPYLTGENLARAAGQMSPDQVVEGFRQVAEGLSWLHKRGLCHGRIKLTNLIYTLDKGIVLVDEKCSSSVYGFSEELARQDRSQLIRALIETAKIAGYEVGEGIEERIARQAAVFEGARLVEEAWTMIEREQMRRALLTLITEDPEIQQRLREMACNSVDLRQQLAPVQQLRSELDDLRSQVRAATQRIQIAELQRAQIQKPAWGTTQEESSLQNLAAQMREYERVTKDSLRQMDARLSELESRSRQRLTVPPWQQPPSAEAAQPISSKARLSLISWIGIVLIAVVVSLLGNLTVGRWVARSVLPAITPTITPVSAVRPLRTYTPSPTWTVQPSPSPTETSSAPPLAQPVLTASPTTVPLLVRITATSVNIRSGPGKDYTSIAIAQRDEVFPLLGRNKDGTWLQIGFRDSLGWVAAEFVTPTGSTSQLPVVELDRRMEATGTPSPTESAEAGKTPTTTQTPIR